MLYQLTKKWLIRLPEHSRLVYQIAIVLALIIFICGVPSVCADEGNESNISANTNETALNETVFDSQTETILVEAAEEEITTEPTILTPVTTLTDALPVVEAQKKSTGQKSINHVQIHIGKKNITNDVAKDISTRSELKAYGVQSLEKILVPSPERVSRYDFVTIDTELLREQLKAGDKIALSIGGTEYPAELSRMDFENIDDGIDSYHGSLTGIKNSDILFTTSDKVLIGRITLENETYWITPAESRQKTETSQPPLHFIYNSGDVTDKIIKIDDGPAPVPEKATELSEIGVSGINQTKASSLAQTPLSQTVTVNILVVTDEAFYNNSYWKPFAQNIIADANLALGTSDINVHLNPIYDDSRRSQFSGDPDVTNHPLNVLRKVYTSPILNATNADIVLYLGGYNVNSDAQGSSWGYGALSSSQPDAVRYAWTQMVGDDPYPYYSGTPYGQSVISIHEIGHLFGACHQNQEGCTPYAHAFHLYPSTKNTVMWDSYNEWYSLPVFSSEVQNYQGLSLGSPTEDNSRNISETRDVVAGYANCNGISTPAATYSWNPASVPVGQEIIFHDDSGNLPISWSWVFGDGGISNLQNPSHTYSTAPPTGTYKVKLTATNCAGSTTTEHDIFVVSTPYESQFSATPTSGNAPLTVQFTDSSTPPPSSWNWSFGDGNVSSVQNPQNTYYKNGNYTVNLTVIINGVSQIKSVQNYIIVLPQPPHSDFTATPTSGSGPLTVQFTDASTNVPNSWLWTFGDGITSTTQNPSHPYLANGTFTISLTATNSTTGSSTTTKTNYITVGPLFASTVGSSTLLIFNQTGSTVWTPPTGVAKVDYLIVAGGGEGGAGYNLSFSYLSGGGGGAGGVLNGTNYPVVGSQTIVVGAGGSGSATACGNRGGNSALGNASTQIGATGGGGGSGYFSGLGSCNTTISGGSGGGGSADLLPGGRNTTSPVQGSPGGNGAFVIGWPGGGGGGAGSAGVAGNTSCAGHGGNGRVIDITGSLVYYGSGGGGGSGSSSTDIGKGGADCGGDGNRGAANPAKCQGTGAGGGGAGGGSGALSHGAGGSGVVIIRYLTPANIPIIPLPGMMEGPTDPDNDGIYEDLNGDGGADYSDIVLFFSQLDWISEHEPATIFDVNQNGRIEFDDIVRMYKKME